MAAAKVTAIPDLDSADRDKLVVAGVILASSPLLVMYEAFVARDLLNTLIPSAFPGARQIGRSEVVGIWMLIALHRDVRKVMQDNQAANDDFKEKTAVELATPALGKFLIVGMAHLATKYIGRRINQR